MKSRLISYTSNDLLYLPIIELNTTVSPLESDSGAYVVPVDLETYNALTTDGTLALSQGFMRGDMQSGLEQAIRVDQGLDTSELSPRDTVNPILLETQYFIQFDNRFGTVTGPDNSLTPVSIDDDNIATYIVTMDKGGQTGAMVSQIGVDASDSSIKGPRGTKVRMGLQSSLDLKTSTFLFNQLGSAGSTALAGPTTLAAADYKFIDTTLRISGVTTGYSLDIPIRLVKKM